jgi:GNAT superfamily N-acetyltransferase
MSFSPRVVCRPALPSDAADVLEFTKFIWDGHDYIKYVWQDWLADPDGMLVVAQYSRHVVGLGKITLLAPGQWWLEGVRVDPNYQGLKIGSHIMEYMNEWLQENGHGDVRYMTSSERFQMHHLGGRLGYSKLGEVRAYKAPALGNGNSRFELVPMGDVASAVDFSSLHLSHSHGLMDSGWKFSAPDTATLENKARQEKLFWWRGRDGLFTFWEDEEDGGKTLGIGFAACAMNALAEMLMDIRRLAQTLGFTSVIWLAPVKAEVESALKKARFATEWDTTGFLYEKKRK